MKSLKNNHLCNFGICHNLEDRVDPVVFGSSWGSSFHLLPGSLGLPLPSRRECFSWEEIVWLKEKPEGEISVPWRWWLGTGLRSPDPSPPACGTVLEAVECLADRVWQEEVGPWRPLILPLWFQPSFLCFLFRCDVNGHCSYPCCHGQRLPHPDAQQPL